MRAACFFDVFGTLRFLKALPNVYEYGCPFHSLSSFWGCMCLSQGLTLSLIPALNSCSPHLGGTLVLHSTPAPVIESFPPHCAPLDASLCVEGMFSPAWLTALSPHHFRLTSTSLPPFSDSWDPFPSSTLCSLSNPGTMLQLQGCFFQAPM